MIKYEDYEVSDTNHNLSLSKLVGSKIVDIEGWVSLDNYEGDLTFVVSRVIFENGDVLEFSGLGNDEEDIVLRNATSHKISGIIFDQKALTELREQDPDYDPEEWDR